MASLQLVVPEVIKESKRKFKQKRLNMKILGIMLLLILTAFQCNAYQPIEYGHSVKRGFCNRMLHYIQEDPARQEVRRQHTTNEQIEAPRGPLTKKLPYIDSVFIRGGVYLQIISAPYAKLTLNAHYPGLAVKVCDGAIYISNSKAVECNQNQRPCIKLYITQLKRLVVAGNSCITGCNLDTNCGLAITHCGSGSVCLNGHVHLVRIESSGNATISLPEVVSDHVHIIASRGSDIRLSGSTGLLLVRAFQQASVDTRFMRTDTALIQADNAALVTVKALYSLRAFASGNSNIYYYTTPGDLLTHNMLSGNVFDMGCCY